ncbi:T9SS type A sorting domain-containing protein [Nonlabens sp. Hel1_33_55]|uniref:T9SS type A sorting domain-containing protein n=1 Tax=Nonlabens sp. Hel1_33_55 TaxID=1336802 RepID=UPI000B828EFF|nr:T9SS type A sorting domain-containing protein [Nonlabens sp. Hel1_33_55]
MKAIYLLLIIVMSQSLIYAQELNLTLNQINDYGSSKPRSLTKDLDGFYFLADNPNVKTGVFYFDEALNKTVFTGISNAENNFIDLTLAGTSNNKLFYLERNRRSRVERLFVYDKISNTSQLIIILEPSTFTNTLSNFYDYNGKAYFSLDNENHGLEPYVSDGTVEGTFLLKDINTNGSSTFQSFVGLNNFVFFIADDNIYGQEIWRTDGTTDGTTLLLDINASGDGANSIYNDPINNNLLFLGYTPSTNGTEVALWKTDGSAMGTSPITSNNSGIVSDSGVITAAQLNGQLYIFSEKGTDVQIWKTNGSSSGTELITFITSNNGSSGIFVEEQIVATDSDIYFLYGNSRDTSNIWRTDGTISGTKKLTNQTGVDNILTDDIHASTNGTIIFANRFTPNREFGFFFKTDPNSDNITMLNAISSSQTTAVDNEYLELNGKTYLVANDETTGFELFSYDSTFGTVELVQDLNHSDSGIRFDENIISTFKDGVLFQGFNGIRSQSGSSLVFANSQPPNNLFLKGNGDKFDRILKSSPNISNDSKYFFAAETRNKGVEPWITDGTQSGTFLLKDINPNGDGMVSGNFDFGRKNAFVANNKFFFNGNTDDENLIFTTDGSVENTKELNFGAGFENSTLQNIYYLVDTYYANLLALSGETRLVQFDFTDEVSNVRVLDEDIVNTFILENSLIVLKHDDFNFIYKVCKLVNNEVVILKEFSQSESDFIDSRHAALLDGTMYFNVGRYSLYKTDGTTNGTERISENFLGSSGNLINNIISTEKNIYVTEHSDARFSRVSRKIFKLVNGVSQEIFSDFTGFKLFFDLISSKNKLYAIITSGGIRSVVVHDDETEQEQIINFNVLNDDLQYLEDGRSPEWTHMRVNNENIFLWGNTENNGYELYSGSIENFTLSIVNPSSSEQPVIKVYPNPSSNLVTIDSKYGLQSVQLFDITGKLLFAKNNLSSSPFKLDTSKLNSGYYLIVIKDENNKNQTIKLVKN